jgi:hypothetical protein
MSRRIHHSIGLLLMLLAVIGQAAPAGGIRFSASALAYSTVICHQDDDPSSPAAPMHRQVDCALCIVCNANAATAILLQPALALPTPPALWIARGTVLPPATGPPTHFFSAARPRGPPFQA